MAKSQTIEDYIKEHGETFYTKKSFVHVVNTGLDTNRLEEDASFLEIKKWIYNIYNGVQFQKDFVRYESVANVHHWLLH